MKCKRVGKYLGGDWLGQTSIPMCFLISQSQWHRLYVLAHLSELVLLSPLTDMLLKGNAVFGLSAMQTSRFISNRCLNSLWLLLLVKSVSTNIITGLLIKDILKA